MNEFHTFMRQRGEQKEQETQSMTELPSPDKTNEIEDQ